MRRVPVDSRTSDWPRKVAQAVNALQAQFANLGDYADDAAAAAGGVPIWGVYRNGSVLMVRVS